MWDETGITLSEDKDKRQPISANKWALTPQSRNVPYVSAAKVPVSRWPWPLPLTSDFKKPSRKFPLSWWIFVPILLKSVHRYIASHELGDNGRRTDGRMTREHNALYRLLLVKVNSKNNIRYYVIITLLNLLNIIL